MIIQRGNFFQELERLKSLDKHQARLDKIAGKDIRKAVKKDVYRNDPQKVEYEKQRRND